MKAVTEIIHCSETTDSFEKKKNRYLLLSVRQTCEMIVEPHHGEHLFTQIDASKHPQHAGSLKAELWYCV